MFQGKHTENVNCPQRRPVSQPKVYLKQIKTNQSLPNRRLTLFALRERRVFRVRIFRPASAYARMKYYQRDYYMCGVNRDHFSRPFPGKVELETQIG